MSKPVFCSLFAFALVLGLAFRLARPELRPMHHDEANQAVRAGLLLESGEYRYDRTDHHGPTLYYLTLPVAWMRGQATLASLDERTLRLVPAVFGAATILLFLLLVRGLGRTAVAASALLAAVSPALTYYSRFYIQETPFVFFTLAFLVALGRYALRPSTGWAITAGVLAGLAYATKETSVIVLGAAVVSCAIALATTGRAPGAIRSRELPVAPESGAASAQQPDVSRAPFKAPDVVLALGAAVIVAAVLFTSFFTNPRGLVESVRAFSVYFPRGLDPGSHAAPWHYYFGLLGWSRSEGVVWTEALVLVLALVGGVVATVRLVASNIRQTRFWPLYIGLYSFISALVFSAVRYKTPWNLLPFYIGFVLMAGSGFAAVSGGAGTVEPAARRPGGRLLRALATLIFLVGVGQLAGQAWRANFRYPADPRSPYVYAQTTTDFLRLVTRVHDLARVHGDGNEMLVKVIAGPYEQWPLPWYLRGMKRVGYWTSPGEAAAAPDAPVVVASQQHAPALDAALADRYVSEFYGLRPGVLLTLYIERGLWEGFIESR